MPHLTAQIAFSTTFKTWLPLLHYLQRLEAMDISKNLEKTVYNAERKLFFSESSLLLIFIYRVPTHYKLAAEPTECLRVIDFYEVLLIY
jgi:hypothetical protein